MNVNLKDPNAKISASNGSVGQYLRSNLSTPPPWFEAEETFCQGNTESIMQQIKCCKISISNKSQNYENI